MLGSIPTIECGCGFNVSSPDIAHNERVFDEHQCYRDNHPRPVAWHQSLFSIETAMIVFLVALFATVTLIQVLP